MNYCTLNDIQQVISEAELIQLTDDTNQSIDTDVVNSAIDYAETTINGYLRSRYTLPLNDIPELLKVFAVDLAVYRIHSRRMVRDMPESLEDRYKNIISELGKIQKGIVSLGIESGSEDTVVAGNNEFISNKIAEDRVFSKDVLTLF